MSVNQVLKIVIFDLGRELSKLGLDCFLRFAAEAACVGWLNQ
jgi:hypothetical protein